MNKYGKKLTEKDACITIWIIENGDAVKMEFKVWADGRTKGFKQLQDRKTMFHIVNNGIRPYIQLLKGRIIQLEDQLIQKNRE